MQATAYCGAPAGLAAMRVVQETLNEVAGSTGDDPDETKAIQAPL